MSPISKSVLARLVEAKVPKKGRRAVTSMLELYLGGEDIDAYVVKYRTLPVSILEFIESEEYLGKRGAVYPEVLRSLEEMNNGSYVEAVLTGSIGCAKTTMAVYTTAYQLYLLSCLRSPHRTYGLDPSSEIIFIFQSINRELAKEVGYNRFRSMIAGSPYFQRHYPFDKSLESKMVFPNRVEVMPVSGQETAAIGQNVIGGVIDELNFMAVVEKSKQSREGGVYDQAVSVYNSLARRRKSRFLSGGTMPGVLCLVSSKRYPGQFTDQKMEEAKTDPTIYVYDKRTWDVKPEGTYTEGWFNMFIGDMTRKPRILEEGESSDQEDVDAGLVMPIPLEHKQEFVNDPIAALRDVAGVSTLARFPFIMNIEAVDKALVGGTIISADVVDFKSQKLSLYPKKIRNSAEPRFAHVDLGLTGDSAGVAVGYVSGFRAVDRGDHAETLPVIEYDLLLEVPPPKGEEIKFWKIRDLFYALRDIGVPLRWVSYDSYQSVDSMQILRHKGFIAGYRSMDTDRMPYDVLKMALYDGRIICPNHARLRRELVSLEDNPKTGKVDHPPGGSKDMADAMAGVCYGLTTRKELWVRHQISPNNIPAYLHNRTVSEDTKPTAGLDTL